MKHTMIAAALLAALAGPALAAPPPPVKPAPDCSGLAQARADARKAAAPLGYDVFDLDGENALAFQKAQDVSPKMQADHATVMVNRKTGRSALLLNDGPRCAFQSVTEALTQPYTTPLDAALSLLRLAR